ncbi:MAG TPA: hypothetical protein VK308_04000 [Pyrinomonadaceae bacterium]|nr:hypothetical protein [Pyrinomonadaceae bacterium]
MIILILLINAALLGWSVEEISRNRSSRGYVFLSSWSLIWIGIYVIQSFSYFILNGFQFAFESGRDKVLSNDSNGARVFGERLRSDKSGGSGMS